MNLVKISHGEFSILKNGNSFILTPMESLILSEEDIADIMNFIIKRLIKSNVAS
jgi:hypothetical protein